MSMFYRRAISRTSWERRKAQREAELAHLQKRGVRLLIVGSLIPPRRRPNLDRPRRPAGAPMHQGC